MEDMYTGSSALARAWYVSSFVVAAFLLLMTAMSASAQTVAPPPDAAPLPTGALPVAVPPIGEAAAAVLPEVQRDETITHEDLGTTPARILPDNPLHFFKRMGRGIQEALTFDPVRDAELKLKHANQQLAEVKQLVEEKGLVAVRPAIIESALDDVQDNIEEVHDTAEALKDAKERQPEIVDRLLNEVADKQIKQQRVLDIIAKEAVEVKAAVEQRTVEVAPAVAKEIDRVVAKAEETKDASVATMTDVLVKVEDSPQNVGVRITNVLDRQAGSEFKELKHLEVLAAVKEKVPEEAKTAIEVAENSTMQKFETKVKELPPVVRAEKFKLYVEDMAADETKLIALLDQIKQAPGIPTDILGKCEEAKELVVKKFERKLKVIKDPRVEEQLLKKLSSDDVDDLVVLEELKSRMPKDAAEFKKIEEVHAASIEQFKKTFAGADSQAQAERFRELSREMLTNPTAKTMGLIATLETEVRADPNKQAFLDQLEKDMKRQFEGQFRREGDKFMERVATLDPRDLAVFQQFEFDPQFVDSLAKRNAAKFKDYMKVVDDPDEFDYFHERFFEVPKTVVDTINTNDTEFRNVMQFKVRKMEEVRFDKERELAKAKLELKEREVVFQASREERKAEEKFREELSSISFEDAEKRKALWEGKINDAYARAEQQYNERRKIFEERAKIDPWCDEQCQQIQLQFVEQSLRHQKEQLSDDLAHEQRRIEVEQAKTKKVPGQEGVFGQACDSVASCEAYCKANPAVVLCKGFITGPVVQICHYPSYWDPGTKSCITPRGVETTVIPTVVPTCPSGQYYDYGRKSCVTDPYYRATTSQQTCPYGSHWNDRSASCELDTRAIYTPPTPVPGEPGRPIGTVVYPDYYPADNVYCGTDFRWDSGRKECVPRDFQTCPSGQYYDFYDKRCKQEWHDCGTGSYWDPAKDQCVKNVYQPVTPGGECPVGFKKDSAGVCVSEWSDIVPPINVFCRRYDEVWNPATKKCEPTKPIIYCTQEYAPVCGVDGATYSNECYAKQAGVAVKTQGSCPKIEPKPTTCPATKYNFQGTFSCDTSVCPGGCSYDGNGCPSGCVGGVNPPVCPSSQYWDSVTRTCKSAIICLSYCDPAQCGPKSYCVYDSSGCSSGCAPTCTLPAWYDSELKKCVTQKERDIAFGCKSGQYWDSYFKTCRDQYCPTGWKWDEASYSCVSTIDPSCKSSCGDTCSSGSWCMFDQKGCATGCSPICPENQYYDQYQKKCVGYYKPTTCQANDYTTGSTSGSGSALCNYTKCPSGCNYDNSGCPSGCYTPPPSSCLDTGYNVKGTGSCDYNKCKNGCSWDTKGCPTGCYTPPVCPDNGFGSSYTSTDGSKYTSCNYTKCPSGCNYDGAGCPNSCYGSGSCGDNVCQNNETTASCPKDCSGGQSCGGLAGLACPPGFTCVYPTNPLYADAMGTCQPTSGGYCGDKICQSGETISSCPADCGTSPSGSCADSDNGIDVMTYGTAKDASGSYYDYCNGDYIVEYWCDSTGKAKIASASTLGYDCKSYNAKYICKDGRCTFPNTVPAVCGDSVCSGTETATSCSIDCAKGGYCGDKVCNASESYASCPGDCGSTGGCRAYTSEASCKSASCTWYNHADGIHCDDAAHGATGGTCPTTAANDYTFGSKTCSTRNCPAGCVLDNNGCPASCTPTSAGYCGDGKCNNTETSAYCPMDCGTGGYCGDKLCVSPETVTSCPGDCSTVAVCSPNIYNANSTTNWSCDAMYCKNGCEFDTKGCATTCKSSTVVACGDHACTGSETAASCPADCGTGATTCTPNIYNGNVTSSGSCDYRYCASGCTWDTKGCATGCQAATGYCGDRICQTGETNTSCPTDCATTTTCPATTFNYGAGSYACNYSTCPSGCTYDSGGCPSGCQQSICNNNGICDGSETTVICPNDCKTTTCPSNGYTIGTATYSCNYTTCPNGCTYDGTGCASGCQPSLCTDNSFNTPGTSQCNSTTCPRGCTWDAKGCPSGCMQSTSTTSTHAGFFRRLGSILYAIITLPARAFGL